MWSNDTFNIFKFIALNKNKFITIPVLKILGKFLPKIEKFKNKSRLYNKLDAKWRSNVVIRFNYYAIIIPYRIDAKKKTC